LRWRPHHVANAESTTHLPARSSGHRPRGRPVGMIPDRSACPARPSPAVVARFVLGWAVWCAGGQK
jgi:hypothetical protein